MAGRVGFIPSYSLITDAIRIGLLFPTRDTYTKRKRQCRSTPRTRRGRHFVTRSGKLSRRATTVKSAFGLTTMDGALDEGYQARGQALHKHMIVQGLTLMPILVSISP